ncbi:MAG: TRAP transporter substrate-binding protein [Azospirillaceae bacterium]
MRNRLIVSLSIVAIMGIAGPVAAQSVTLHMAHNTQVEHPIHQAAERFAELVAERTEGDVEVIVYPNEQLANLRAGAEGVQLGTIDMAWSDSGTLGNWAPQFSFVSLPFIFADFDHAVSAMDALAPDLTVAMREALNVERLAWSPGGFRVILSNGRPVNEAADIDGLKIRVPEIPVYVAAFAALNANATPLPWGDVYTALQTGVVEGVEGPPAAIQTAGFAEVSEYMARTNHIMNDLNLLMNLDRFNALTPEVQEIIRTSAHEAVDVWLREVMRENYDVAYQALAEMLEENDNPDVESFRQAMLPVWEDFIADAGPQAEAWINATQSN